MVEKTKNYPSNIESIVSSIGMTVITVATMLHVAELPHSNEPKMTGTLQPVYASAQPAESQAHSEDARRSGREEVRHSSATFGAVMRSHPTAGSQ